MEKENAMSHFSVLIKIPETALNYNQKYLDIKGIVAELLIPYKEHDGDCPEEYLEFEDIEDESIKEYNTGSTEVVMLPDGRLLSVYDREFGASRQAPKELKRTNALFKLIYKTFEEFMRDWCGYNERDEKTGRYGSWVNPNAKWDWYQIGGRWFGQLKVKDIAEAFVYCKKGEPSLLCEDKKYPEFCFDICKVKDLDTEWYEKQKERKIDEFMREVEKTRNDPESVTDSYFIEKRLFDFGLAKQKEGKLVISDFTREDLLNKLGGSFDFSTYAVIEKDGTWHEQGTMGWFGMDNSTPEKRESWYDGFMKQFITDEDPETILVMVDCHI